MVQVSDQDMNTHLAEISRVRATELGESKGALCCPRLSQALNCRAG